MPRAGLDAEAVVQSAASIADQEGLQRLSLSKLARRLNIRTPSLYAHVKGLDDLRRRIAIRAARQLTDDLQRAAAGVSGADALRKIAVAYRSFAHRHPGMYASLQPAPAPDVAFTDLVDVVLAVIHGYGLRGENAMHAVRIVRSALHGFVALESEHGFGLELDLDRTFERLIATLDQGLRRNVWP
jgi:AcrR family transcriptional regulator